MANIIKDAFGEVRADEGLKKRTEEYVLEKAKNRTCSTIFKSARFRASLAICLCFFFLIIGGNWLVFTPTTEINIDINPSLGLGVNRFNQVVSVDGLNEDGLNLSKQLNLKFENYNDALEQILNNKTIEDLLAKDNVVVITVTGTNESQTQQICAEIEIRSAEYDNAHCSQISSDEAEEAHELGLSYGKYLAYLKLIDLDPSFTPEEIQGMTMREIEDLIERLSGLSESDESPNTFETVESTENGTQKETTPNGNANSGDSQSQTGADQSQSSENMPSQEAVDSSGETGHHGEQAHHGYGHD